MAKNEFAGAMEHYTKMLKKMDKSKIRIQSDCPHHSEKDGRLTAVNVESPKPTEKKLKCTSCKKLINIYRMDENDIDSHINAMDSMCDLIKMRADLKNERDREAYKIAAKMQYRTLTFIKDAYKSAINVNKKKNKGNNNNYSGVTINKPVIR